VGIGVGNEKDGPIREGEKTKGPQGERRTHYPNTMKVTLGNGRVGEGERHIFSIH